MRCGTHYFPFVLTFYGHKRTKDLRLKAKKRGRNAERERERERTIGPTPFSC